MKTSRVVASSLVLLGWLSSSNAQIIPVATHSKLSATGSAIVPPQYGGEQQSYSFTKIQDGVRTSLTDSVTGVATAHITILPPFELYLGTLLEATSAASQSFLITPSSIALSTAISAYGSMFSQVGSRGSYAESTVSIQFQITQPVIFVLSGNGGFHVDDYPNASGLFSFALTGSSGPVFSDMSQGGWGGLYYGTPRSGTLDSGQYTLSTTMSGPGGVCPYGHGTSGNQSVLLSVTAVPDECPTLLLLSIALALLGALNQHSFQRVQPLARTRNSATRTPCADGRVQARHDLRTSDVARSRALD